MPSKKAVFESKDPSGASESLVGTRKGDNDVPVEKTSFESQDVSDIDFDTGESVNDGNTVAEKSSFYTRESELESDEPALPRKKKYEGVERRKFNRRSGKDRRGDVRFDLDKSDRRESEGRREEDHTPKYW
jgi:hypothetical protein